MNETRIILEQSKPLFPWTHEPNFKVWFSGNIECHIRRCSNDNGLGHLCGYAKIPEGHPWRGLSYSEIDRRMSEWVHGGLTYGDKTGVVGFDCAHRSDYIPGKRREFGSPDHYKTVSYVEEEVEKMVISIQVGWDESLRSWQEELDRLEDMDEDDFPYHAHQEWKNPIKEQQENFRKLNLPWKMFESEFRAGWAF